MSELPERLSALAGELDALVKEAESPVFLPLTRRLADAANAVGRSWSGSWIGYQSRVYYVDLEPTPPGAIFSIEWGFRDAFSMGTEGDWAEYSFDTVYATIFSNAGVADLKRTNALSERAKDVFSNARDEFLSIATVTLENKADAFLSRIKAQAEEMKIFGKFDFVRAMQPNNFFTRDSLAMGQGIQTPPHIAVLAEVTALQDAPKKCSELAKILRRAASHLDTRERHKEEKRSVGTKVFLGHGRSTAWKDLKDFIQDRMDLPFDEFNRVPIAGTTNIARLSQMLDEAAIAFIVMTAEDEQIDGTVRARMNVIHEAGLFQGKLGFSKAILVLEEGCEEFSNIHGLGQIRFPKGNIGAKFEEVRLVLEREGLVEE